MPARGVTTAGRILAAATALTFLSSAIAYNLTISDGRSPALWYRLVAINGCYWYLWAAFVPMVAWLSRRFRLEWHSWKRSVPVHLVAATALSSVHILTVTTFQYVTRIVEWKMSFATALSRALAQNFDWELVAYMAIAGVSHALLYYREAQERRLTAAALETKLAQAQLQNLQRQLHPHFLFNTLNAIAALMHRDVNAADNMLAGLGDLLRMSLQRLDVVETSLKEELEFLQKYVDIECTRFQDRLTVSVTATPETLDALVPTLILQPLVENAIEHGIAPACGHGHVEVLARRERDALLLEVRDDGAGSPDSEKTAGHGIGLSTTRARLMYQYGAACRFEVERPPAGFVVRMAIPWRVTASSGGEASESAAEAPATFPGLNTVGGTVGRPR